MDIIKIVLLPNGFHRVFESSSAGLYRLSIIIEDKRARERRSTALDTAIIAIFLISIAPRKSARGPVVNFVNLMQLQIEPFRSRLSASRRKRKSSLVVYKRRRKNNRPLNCHGRLVEATIRTKPCNVKLRDHEFTLPLCCALFPNGISFLIDQSPVTTMM